MSSGAWRPHSALSVCMHRTCCRRTAGHITATAACHCPAQRKQVLLLHVCRTYAAWHAMECSGCAQCLAAQAGWLIDLGILGRLCLGMPAASRHAPHPEASNLWATMLPAQVAVLLFRQCCTMLHHGIALLEFLSNQSMLSGSGQVHTVRTSGCMWLRGSGWKQFLMVWHPLPITASASPALCSCVQTPRMAPSVLSSAANALQGLKNPLVWDPAAVPLPLVR